MLDPLTIVDMAAQHFAPVKDLQHLNIMITAGPTREPLDPVRYITNHSSGKMGFAIAAAAAQRGERDAGERPGIAADAAVCAAN
jgi:phosphopantothenoylcysteine decarboxylase/phosphopantothenate--cysteine ligase